VTALIFDCDGVLADTERHGHLPAFNQTFAEFGLPVRWSEEEYADKLRIGGGKERMASLLTPDLVREAALPTDAEGQRDVIAAWHARKTAIYTDMVQAGALPARPGVARVIGEALDGGWTLAVASTSAEASVRAVLDHVAGAEQAGRFAVVLAGDVVPHKKPAPDIYELALDRLGEEPSGSLVIEDSRNGLEAASGAGLRCVITVNGYTENEDFTEAALVVSSLGDPGGERSRVLANRSRAAPGDWVTLRDLEACLES
jgi:HAD superfamily hydrolase (TIGR01509 family)